MLVSQCPCSAQPIVLTESQPAAGQCPPSCEISASATITIQEQAARTILHGGIRATDEAGIVAAGRRSVSFLNDGGADGYVDGILFKNGTSLMYPPGLANDVHGAITYDATGTSFRIDWTYYSGT